MQLCLQICTQKKREQTHTRVLTRPPRGGAATEHGLSCTCTELAPGEEPCYECTKEGPWTSSGPPRWASQGVLPPAVITKWHCHHLPQTSSTQCTSNCRFVLARSEGHLRLPGCLHQVAPRSPGGCSKPNTGCSCSVVGLAAIAGTIYQTNGKMKETALSGLVKVG